MSSEQTKLDNIFSVCGLMGGVIFATSLLPQLWKTYRTKSAFDLNYFWQAFYVAGIILLVIYGIGSKLWPLVFPMAGDIIFMTSLIVMKWYYDNHGPKSAKVLKEKDEATAVGDGDDEGPPEGHVELTLRETVEPRNSQDGEAEIMVESSWDRR